MLPVATLPLVSDWPKVACFCPLPRSKSLRLRLLLSDALQGPGCLLELVFLLSLPRPTSPLGAELPNQLWEHLFTPVPLGRLSLATRRLWRAALSFPGACFALAKLAGAPQSTSCSFALEPALLAPCLASPLSPATAG